MGLNSNGSNPAHPPIWSGHPKSHFGRLSHQLCAPMQRRCVISVVTAFARDTAVVRRALSAFVVRFHRCSGPMFKIKVAPCNHGTNDAAHAPNGGLPAIFSAPSPQLSHRRNAPTKRHCGILMPFSVMKMIKIESTVIVALTHALNVVIRDMGLGLLRRLEAHPSPLTHSLRSSRRSCFRGTNAPISSMLVP